MDILNAKTLRQQADQALRRGRDPKKLIYAYGGICLAISLAIFLANLWLDDQISGTAGLGNMGSRAIFSTAQQLLPLLSGLAVMCLDLGFLGGLLRISRGQYADHTDLKAGFRKFWPLVRLALLQSILCCAVLFLGLQLGSLLFTFTPWAEPLLEMLTPFLSGTAALDDAAVAQAIALMAPMLIIMGIASLILLIPVLFRMRMALFCLLDDPRGRALAAMRESNRMMRRRFGQMLKIDLSLWLYYAATAAMYLVLWLDVILSVLGVPFPMEADLFAMVVLLASILIQFAIHVLLRPHTEMTYLAAYDSLREKPREDGVVLGNIFDM